MLTAWFNGKSLLSDSLYRRLPDGRFRGKLRLSSVDLPFRDFYVELDGEKHEAEVLGVCTDKSQYVVTWRTKRKEAMWITADGRRIPVREMTNGHLLNSYYMLVRGGCCSDAVDSEIARRGLNPNDLVTKLRVALRNACFHLEKLGICEFRQKVKELLGDFYA